MTFFIDYEIVHKPGATNAADYYSRHPLKSAKNDFLEEIQASAETEGYINAFSASKLPRSVTIDEMREATRSDPDLQVLLKLIGKENGKVLIPINLSCYRLIFHELN